MSKIHPVDNSNINSLVDGELDSVESAALLEQIEQDAELKRELCDTHRIKDLVKMAYPEQQFKQNRAGKQGKNAFWSLAASVVLVAIGFLMGSYFQSQNSEIEQLYAMNQLPDAEQTHKLLLFVGYSDNQKFEETLNRAEAFLKKHQNHPVQVNIVTSAGGLDLLNRNKSRFLSRISDLSKKYDALEFVACNNTIARMKQDGKKVDIINDAVVAPSAVEFVVKRLQQGWAYIAI